MTRHAIGRNVGMAILLALALLVGYGASPAQAVGAGTISGRVTLGGPAGPAVSGALVVATYNGTPPGSVRINTGASGEYSLTVPVAGSYSVSVRQPDPVGTSAPQWVAVGEPRVVSVPPSQAEQSFVVQPATVIVSGTLAAPGGVPFTGDNLAWVRAENQEGQGNTVQVQASGAFLVPALPGAIRLHVTLKNPAWASPIALRDRVYNAAPNTTINVEPSPLPVVVRGGQISGVVQIKAPNGSLSPAPAGVPVRAWRVDGSDFQEALTGPNGIYSMAVISGTWAIRAVPLPNVTYGVAVGDVGGDYLVPAQPPQKAELDGATSSVVRNLLVAVADVTVTGRTIRAPGGALVTAPDADGRVYATYFQDGKPQPGPTAPLADGAFGEPAPLRLSTTVATTYTVGIYFPPDAPYSALDRALVGDLVPGFTKPITISIAQDTSHITGRVALANGSYPAGVQALVWGVSDGGGWARTPVSPSTGAYDLAVPGVDVRDSGGSTWLVRPIVDPQSGYLLQRPRERRVFVPFNGGAGATAGDVDFTLAAPSSFGVIEGVARGPAGAPLPGVRVVAREFAAEGSAGLERGETTGLDGRYRLRVPPGAYRVSAFDGRPANLPRELVPPPPAVADVTTGVTTTINLAFRAPDAPVWVQVNYQGGGHSAMLRARASDGTRMFAAAGPGGQARFKLIAGLAWTIDAVSSEGSDFLRSATATISPTARTTPPAAPDVTLTLVKAASIPEPQVFVFPADTDQVFTMGDGSKVQIPAGAMAPDSRDIVLTVNPIAEIAGDASGVRPISFGYRLKANEALSRQPVTSFLQPVTLVVPFTAAQLRELGATPSQLTPSYWDEASASWKPVSNVSVTVDADGGGSVNITVEHFTDFALLVTSDTMQYLPLLAK